jgi:NADH:ubiquinone oxidoreductase subunit 3 (subunit A)
VYYEPAVVEGLDSYIGMVIVAAIVIIYFAAVCCLSVYLKGSRQKKLKEMEMAELEKLTPLKSSTETKKNKKLRKNATLSQSKSVIDNKVVKLDEL